MTLCDREILHSQAGRKLPMLLPLADANARKEESHEKSLFVVMASLILNSCSTVGVEAYARQGKWDELGESDALKGNRERALVSLNFDEQAKASWERLWWIWESLLSKRKNASKEALFTGD
ncbi:hypothetical protein RJ45_13660 [Photobacterium gaetbulicola]|uniref:Uncharacterized protein n=1 Tax=Photobacterium gaetbulicola TaxID=1295392 RepID=A0A0B9G3B0_9GAMM|nr:hypothetical protein [Photobacterium gaetbulicola]KHT63124.1 hypothetical protein RJ45_13660 [Photobacterium gaetbulicola]